MLLCFGFISEQNAGPLLHKDKKKHVTGDDSSIAVAKIIKGLHFQNKYIYRKRELCAQV